MPDFVVEANEEKRHVIIPFTPHDTNCTARSGLEETFRASGAQQFDAESVRGVTRGVIGADLTVGFDDERLFVGGEVVEALNVALLVQEPHLPLLQAFSQHRSGRPCIGDDVARLYGESILQQPIVGDR